MTVECSGSDTLCIFLKKLVQISYTFFFTSGLIKSAMMSSKKGNLKKKLKDKDLSIFNINVCFNDVLFFSKVNWIFLHRELFC